MEVREPVIGRPIIGHPIKVEPVQTEPIEAHPIEAHPIEAHPIEAHPVAHPIEVQPTKPEPGKTEPVKATPIKNEPVKPDPIKVNPIKTEPVKVDPKASPFPVEPSEIVTAIAAAIAGRAFTGGQKRPDITPDHILHVLSGAGFAKTVPAETLSQTKTLLASKKSVTLIANATALSAHLLRARLNASNKAETPVNSPIVQGTPVVEPHPIGEPIKSPLQGLHGPIHEVPPGDERKKGGPALV